ncbi:IS110 family transposase [bacterium]|nr:IS110 family transposase [bacterium]
MMKYKFLAEARRVALGLDVDAKAVVVAALDVTSGEILFQGRLSHRHEDWQRFLARFPRCELWACYEAGYTGFHLCRMLRELGVDCRVVAPSQVPKSVTNRQQKTDRRDALMLAQLYFHPPRSFVRVPTEAEEQDRQLLRTREQLVRDKTRIQNRIKALLAFHHLAWPSDRRTGPWSQATLRSLRALELPEPLRVCLTAQLDALDGLYCQIRILDQQIVALSRGEASHDRCALLRHIPGVGRLTAMAFLLEIFRPHEFETAEALAAHVGFTCCEWSSSSRRRLGHITHWGSPILRRLLIEAAWSWVRKDPQAKRQFETICAHSKRRKIAIVGMARCLAIVMWAMTVRQQEYAYRWAA